MIGTKVVKTCPHLMTLQACYSEGRGYLAAPKATYELCEGCLKRVAALCDSLVDGKVCGVPRMSKVLDDLTVLKEILGVPEVSYEKDEGAFAWREYIRQREFEFQRIEDEGAERLRKVMDGYIEEVARSLLALEKVPSGDPGEATVDMDRVEKRVPEAPNYKPGDVVTDEKGKRWRCVSIGGFASEGVAVEEETVIVASLSNAGLTEKSVNDPEFEEAWRKMMSELVEKQSGLPEPTYVEKEEGS